MSTTVTYPLRLPRSIKAAAEQLAKAEGAEGSIVTGGLSSPLETVFFVRMLPDRFLDCRFLLVPAPWVVATKGEMPGGRERAGGGRSPPKRRRT